MGAKKPFSLLYPLLWGLWRPLVLMIVVPSFVAAAETVVLKVFVNQGDKGDHFLLMTGDGDVLLPLETLEEFGIFPERKAGGTETAGTDEKRPVSLRSFEPGISFRIDEKASALHIAASPELFESREINLSPETPRDSIASAENSAFFNYQLYYSLGDNLDFVSFSLPTELGVRTNDWLFQSSASYRQTDDERNLFRLTTNAIHDFPSNMVRLTIGDSNATSGFLGSAGRFGGIGVSKYFGMSPYFKPFPELDISRVIDTPSNVTVYVDGRKVSSERLDPGEYTFEGLPAVTGAGETRVVIEDAFGRIDETATPFYLSSALLKKGLEEFDYMLGFKRESMGSHNDRYTDLSFLCFHRVGVTDGLTLGFRAEADADVANLGPTATFLLGPYGEISATAAVSQTWDENREFGAAGSLDYVFRAKRYNLRFSCKKYSENYGNLYLMESSDKPDYTFLGGVGVSTGKFGSFSASFSRNAMRVGDDFDRTVATYSRGVAPGVSLSVTASWLRGEYRSDEIFAALHFSLGKSRSGSLFYSQKEDFRAMRGTVQKSPPCGPGFGYRISAGVDNPDDCSSRENGEAALDYRGAYGILGGSVRKYDDSEMYDLKFSGGLTFLDGAMRFSRPVTDSFALVRIEGAEGVNVKYSNRVVGETNDKGEMIIPDLISYYYNRISVDSGEFPIDMKLDKRELYVFPGFRAGGVAVFDAVRLKAFEGNIYILEKGKKRSAQYAGLKIRIDGNEIETVLGDNGFFYLENISPGKWPAHVFWETGHCDLIMEFPESDEMSVDMKEFVCEMD